MNYLARHPRRSDPEARRIYPSPRARGRAGSGKLQIGSNVTCGASLPLLPPSAPPLCILPLSLSLPRSRSRSLLLWFDFDEWRNVTRQTRDARGQLGDEARKEGGAEPALTSPVFRGDKDTLPRWHSCFVSCLSSFEELILELPRGTMRTETSISRTEFISSDKEKMENMRRRTARRASDLD